MLPATGVPPAISKAGDPGLSNLPQVVAVRPTGGLNTNFDPADIKNEEFVVAANMRNRYDKSFRRTGLDILSVLAPDSSRINKLFISRRLDGSFTMLRVSEVGIYKLGISSITNILQWFSMTGSPASIGRSVFMASIYRFIVMADGKNPLQYISLVDVTSPPTAPIAKFVAGFYERVIAAFILNDPDGAIMVMWSGRFDGTDASLLNFDFSVDESAGFWKLIDSPSDLGDHITGLQAFTNFIIVPRMRSMWIGVKQESPSNPLRFYCAIPGIGCDIPKSIVVAKDVIIWADSRTRGVYISSANDGQLTRLDIKINTQLFDEIKALGDSFIEDVIGEYNARDNEYMLKVGPKMYIYNLLSESWVTDDNAILSSVTAITSIDDASSIIMQTAIDELVGDIDSLVGSIDNLGVAIVFKDDIHRYYGLDNGNIIQESKDADTDYGDSYDTVWRSKIFESPYEDIIINRLLIEYGSVNLALLTTAKLEYSTDYGDTWIIAKNTFYVEKGRSKVIILNRTIKCRTFQWQLTVGGGDFSLLRYEMHKLVGGATGVGLNP